MNVKQRETDQLQPQHSFWTAFTFSYFYFISKLCFGFPNVSTLNSTQLNCCCCFECFVYGAYTRRCGSLIVAPNGDAKKRYVSDVVMVTQLVLVTAA